MQLIFSNNANFVHRGAFLIARILFGCLVLTGLASPAEIGVLSMAVDGKAVQISSNRLTQIAYSPGSVDINYGLIQHGKPFSDSIRIRCKLDGVDGGWREGDSGASQMRLSIGFLDVSGNEVKHVDFLVSGQSPGWTGSFETSPMQHRREKVVVPLGAATFWVVISSAGGPESMGVFFVANLSVQRLDSTDGVAGDLLQTKLIRPGQNPAGWRRDGLRTSMAQVIQIGGDQSKTGLAVVDDYPDGHAQWNTLKGLGPQVRPLDLLVLEWDEMFSVGAATPAAVSYKNLAPGFYRLNLSRLSLMGVPTGDETSIGFEVLTPYWRSPWFWVSAALLSAGIVFGGWRYREARQLQLENARLAQQRALEAERFRIARDIHDDVGARVTQISLLSSASEQKPGLSPEIRADFAAVCEMSRSLVGALYETVWAISPENDHLDSVGTYICQMANQMCRQAGLKCRLQVPDLPHEVPITSSIRHNLVMTVKESIHNVIKHAEATEVQIKVQFENGLLAIEVKDNGKGFDPSTRQKGNGLLNMERRMSASGGRWAQSSQPGEGTCVRLDLKLPGNGGSQNEPGTAAIKK